MLGPSVSSSGGWYSARSGNTPLAVDHLRGGNELALAWSRQHLKAVTGLVWRGAEVDALVCARLQLVSLQCLRARRIRQAEHRAKVAQRWRSTCLALVRGHAVVSSLPAVVRHVGDQAGLLHGVLPAVLLAGAAMLVHHAHGLLQRAHVALGRVLPRLVLAAVGVEHVEVLEHEADLGTVKYKIVVAVERATSKVADMVALLVAHKVGAQRGGELVLGCDEANVAGALVHVGERRPIAVARALGRPEWANQVRAGPKLPATVRGGAFAQWRMDAWCIGRKCGIIGQVVWLSMCARGRRNS
eukprot:6211942-Pleurochrysis_carterae.AAC.3